MTENNVQWPSNLTKAVVKDAIGYPLCAYLVALEGWRRGLTLKWYVAETEIENFKKVGKIHHGKLFSLSSPTKTHFFFRSKGDLVSNEAVAICEDKEETKKRLQLANVPVPLGRKFRSNTQDDLLIEYAEEIGYPVVLKPTNGSLGKGVYTNIKNKAELKEALTDLRKQYNYSNYIVEKYHPGKEYRVYVVGDKVIAASNRVPANITGDGRHTIKELIEIKNKEKKKNPYLASKEIKIDFEVKKSIDRNGYTLNTILKDGELLYLREKSNLSAGGDPLDATDELTDEAKQVAVNALRAIPNLPHAGVDIIVDSNSEKGAVIIEINTTAEIGFHLFPLLGKTRDVPGAIIDYYFPETSNQAKTNFYFDFKSALEPLKTRTANVIEIAQAPSGTVESQKFTISRVKSALKFMYKIRRIAFNKNIHGSARQLSNGKIVVIIAGTNQESFKEVKSYIESLCGRFRTTILKEEYWDKPVKIGFKVQPPKVITSNSKVQDELKKEKEKREKAESKYMEIVNSRAWKYVVIIRKGINLFKKKRKS